jgi:metal-sulfur cluster biosynthetic enzyme
MEQIESRLLERLKRVIDPGANLNVVDMGLIKELSFSNDVVNVIFRPSSPICPLAFVLAANIKKALEEMDEVSSVHLKVVDFVRADELNKIMEDIENQS